MSTTPDPTEPEASDPFREYVRELFKRAEED